MPISHSSTISMERMLLLYAILTKNPLMLGKLSSRRFMIVLKRR
ncbi:hypothetical protein Gotur_014947 [Gossypium turneri]